MNRTVMAMDYLIITTSTITYWLTKHSYFKCSVVYFNDDHGTILPLHTSSKLSLNKIDKQRKEESYQSNSAKKMASLASYSYIFIKI